MKKANLVSGFSSGLVFGIILVFLFIAYSKLHG